MKHGGRVPAIALATLGVVMAMLAAVTPADAATWSATALPVDAGTNNVEIKDVDCWSAGNCVAVGQAASRQVVVQEVAGVWHQVAGADVTPVNGSPSGRLDSVSCPSAGFCVAVGRNGPDNSAGSTGLIVTLKNGSWSAIAAPSVSDQDYQAILTEVSCVSSSFCAAVGYTNASGGPFVGQIETYDGSSWTARAVSSPTVPSMTVTATKLAGVSCAAAGSCVAVGQAAGDGGASRGLIATLSGGSWSSASAPEPSNAFANLSALTGVSCSSSTECAAIGTYGSGNVGNADDELLVRSGSTWSAEQAPRPGASPQVELADVSCASDGTCAVVGHYIGDANGSYPLVYTDTGSGWDTLTVTLPANAAVAPTWVATSDLYGVSCTSATSCVAGGFYGGDPNLGIHGYLSLLVEVDPSSPSAVAKQGPVPGDAVADYKDEPLNAVSCSDATHCTAVGHYTTGTGTTYNKGLAVETGAASPPPATLPKVGDVSPDRGSKRGGTKVTISGSGFKGKVKVLFGTKAGTNVKIKTSKKLTVITPAHPKGTVSVKVRTAAGTSKTSKATRFTFQ